MSYEVKIYQKVVISLKKNIQNRRMWQSILERAM